MAGGEIAAFLWNENPAVSRNIIIHGDFVRGVARSLLPFFGWSLAV
jgi:hypothetical protein